MIRAFVLSAIGAVLTGCVPSEKIPVTGKVTLEYQGTTDTDVLLELSNGTARSISVQGSFNIWRRGIEITPNITGIECTAGRRSDEDATGFSDPPYFVQIPSGQRVRIIIPTTLPQRFKGGRCSLHLFTSAGFDSGHVDFGP